MFDAKAKIKEEAVVINIGSQGMTKIIEHTEGENAGKRESKLFMPDVPVGCSKIMADYLLAKYNSPAFEIQFRSANIIEKTKKEVEEKKEEKRKEKRKYQKRKK